MKLFVGSLPYSFKDEELQKLFESHGSVTSARVVLDRETGRSRGFGFIEMSSKEEAQSAIEALNGSSVEGRSIVVSKAHDKAPR